MARPAKFGDLPDEMQDLISNAFVLHVLLEEPEVDIERLRPLSTKVCMNTLAVLKLLTNLYAAADIFERDSDHLREQLEAIGRKAFWAKGRTGENSDKV